MPGADRPRAPVEGRLLWEPSPERRAATNMVSFSNWLVAQAGRRFTSYADLWGWSVDAPEVFWSSIWRYFAPPAEGSWSAVCEGTMPGVRWFPGLRLNYAAQALRGHGEATALIGVDESGDRRTLSYAELRREVFRVARALRALGVGAGDRVAAFMPNLPETVIAFLASASIGAIWSVCAPEFGTGGVLDRFRQIEPKVLLAVGGYRYNGRWHDRRAAVAEIRSALPSVTATVMLAQPDNAPRPPGVLTWEMLREAGPASDLDMGPPGALDPAVFEPVGFDHPLWILYTSGTTGPPKPIVHSHGGILVEHMKGLSLHLDLKPGDRFFWFTTTGWMMWNFLLGGLLLGCSVVLYDGSPTFPDPSALWGLAADLGVSYFGTSAAYLQACQKQGLEPGRRFDLGHLQSVGSTGAPLLPEQFVWVYEHVAGDLLLGSVSGGTDVCSVLVGSCPTEPVLAGEIQGRWLGVAAEAYDSQAKPVVGEVGELVLTAPLPSMPIRFWNDPAGRRYRASYFETFAGVWRHGDWIRFTPRGSCIIYGRSDATLNRSGLRMGTSEFYRVVEGLPEVKESLVVDASGLGGDNRLWLFVVLQPGYAADEPWTQRLRQLIRDRISPRHVPDEIRAVPALPHTLNGKRLEVPLRRLLAGQPLESAVSPAAVDHLEALRALERLARSQPPAPPSSPAERPDAGPTEPL